jgi:hypothetical protein
MKNWIFTSVCFAAALTFFVGCEEQQKSAAKVPQLQAKPMKSPAQQRVAKDKQYAPPAQVQQTHAPSADVLERVLDEASQKGIEVIHNATVVPSGAYSSGQMTMPAGTEYDGFTPDGVHTYYKNKEDTLTTAGSPEGIKYINGKGAVKYKSKLYCFGF